MVILHIASINSDPYNGVCLVVPRYVIEQDRLGHKVGLLNVSGEIIDSIERILIKKNTRKIDELPKPFDKPDIVVFQECYRKEYIPIWPQLVRKKIPYVIIPHGELGEEAQKKKSLKKKLANLLIFNKFTKQAEMIQCLSERELIGTHFGKKKIIIPNGIDIPSSVKEEFNQDRIQITYIGRLDAYHKGLDLLIQATHLIHDELVRENVKICIYGPDIKGRKAFLEEMIIYSNVEDVIEINNPVVGKEKEKILLDSDLFIQTSRFEGMPLGVLEAMSYGIPCILTEGTTLGVVAENNKTGWKAETDSKSIADTILRAIDERAKMSEYGTNGRKYVKSNYAWETISKLTISDYFEVINGISR